MEICVSVVTKLAEFTVTPIWRKLSYLIHYKSNVEHLTSQTERLVDKREGAKLAVEAATRNLETITPEVETWLCNVNKTIQEKETCFGNERVEKARCFNGWCSNLKSRRYLSEKAKKMSLVVDNLLRDGSFTRVSYPAPPPEIGFSAIHAGGNSSGTSNPAPPAAAMEFFEGPQHKLPYSEEILKALQDDSIDMIGIAGIIKREDAVTTKEFIRRVKEQDLFEEVVVAVVSQNPDLKGIQGVIADVLGLTLEDRSLLERAKKLSSRIMSMDSKRFLVILADVWELLDLAAIGILGGDSKERCKIILVAQHPNVFSEVRTKTNFKLLLTSTSVKGKIHFESRNLIIRDVMNALTDDQINPVAICGMGGIGKTTLVKEVGKRAKALGLFDEVAMAVFTQTPDLSNIQQEIADFLGLKLTGQSLAGRANKLKQRLSGNKRVLVILDNVWTQIDLEEVGIPSCCKILVSSRNQDIFNDIETKRNFPISFLPEQDAWSLFKNMAGRSIESPELCPVAQQVLSECAGLPIAISTVGRALRHKSKKMWDDALTQLRNACPENIPGMIHEVYRTIELSYECLESEEAKSCFFLCCLYPESSNIPVEDLVRYGFRLGLFKGIDSLVQGRNRVETLVDILKSCFLLLDSNKEGCVKMHDVVRDVALLIASDGKGGLVARHKVELKDWPGKYTSSTLVITNKTRMHNELLSVSCTDKCPLEPPATILRTSEDIKVLAISSRFPLSILPSIPLMRNLQTLRLENCNLSVETRSVIGELRTLMILSFRGSNFNQFPDEIKNLSNLRLLDLTGCGFTKIPMGVISSLARLEELYMWNSFEHWETEERTQAQLDEENRCKDRNQGSKIRGITCYFAPELSSLSQLTTLEIALNPLVKPTGVQFDKFERFKISIGWWNKNCWDVNPCENYLRLSYAAESPAESGLTILLERANVLELDMRYMRGTLSDLRRNCCLNLKSLMLRQSEDLPYVFDMGYVSIFPVLHTLKMDELTELRAVFRGKLPMGSFNELRELSLSFLPKLTHLWKMTSQFDQCLGNLRRVKVSRCYLLKYLFLLSVASHLKQLEELDIQNCHDLEEIIALKDRTSKQIVATEGSEHEEDANEISLPNLLRLNLEGVRSFVGISKTICKINFPGLVTLKLENLPKITSLCPDSFAPEGSIADAAKQHLFDTKVSPFWQLRFVTVKECGQLLGIFSFSWVQDLQRLEQLEVRECRSLETVFGFDDLENKQNPKQFPALLSELEIIELTELPMLKYLWNPPQNIMAFQNLRMLQVMRCENLRYAFPLSVAENLVKLESMYISDCAAMRDILAKNERGHGDEEATERIVFPQVKSLHFDNLPHVRTFCRAPCTIDWPSLTTLVIGCLTMKTFVPSFVATGSIDDVSNHILNEKVDFPVLETLEIRDMDNFGELWSRQLLPYSFCELRDLHVSGCSNLVLLVPVEVQNRLHKLEKLIVKGCNSLEDIFESTGSNANEEHAATLSQSGETSSISQPQMMRIRDSNRIQGFQLTSLHISGCGSLEFILSPSIARGMVKLKGLSIIECKKMEVVVAKPLAAEETEDNSLLPQLSNLKLRALPNLISFSQGKCTLDWPSLEELTVEECPRMEKFCLGSLGTPREVKLSISGAGENLQTELNDSRKET